MQIAKDDDFRAVSRSCGGNRLSSWSLSSSQWVSGTADVLLRLPGTDRVVMVALIKTVSAAARRRLETSSAGHRQGIDNPFGGTHMALPQLLDRRHRRLASGETQSFVLAVAVQWPIQQYRGSLGIIRPCGPTCTETENRGGGVRDYRICWQAGMGPGLAPRTSIHLPQLTRAVTGLQGKARRKKPIP